MTQPIIDPNTLTEEQREAIKAEYEFNFRCALSFKASTEAICRNNANWHKGKCDELVSLFGKNFFKKGE